MLGILSARWEFEGTAFLEQWCFNAGGGTPPPSVTRSDGDEHRERMESVVGSLVVCFLRHLRQS